ncbi:MAG: hypothetical protein KGL39_26115 [Patescibacteria group bacterium]|nr:hypothetical protein [Patescibacteria group bacterium]
MSEKYGIPRGVRITQRNCDRLEMARKLGFSASRIINEMLERHLPDYLDSKIRELREALDGDGPNSSTREVV